MKLIIPVKLKFHYSSYKHRGYMENRFNNGEINITDNVKAVIADSLAKGLNTLTEDIRDWLSFILKDGVELRDFTLTYSEANIVDGKVWGGTGVVSETKLK